MNKCTTLPKDISFLRIYSAQKGGLVPLDNLLNSHAAMVKAQRGAQRQEREFRAARVWHDTND